LFVFFKEIGYLTSRYVVQ